MWFHNHLRLFLIAVQFLTRLPVRLKKKAEPQEFSKSLVYFPIIGLLLGLGLVFTEYILAYFLPVSIVKLYLVCLLIVITGGLHLDGLADTIDALASGKCGKEALRVMAEGSIGPIGVAAVIICLATKYLVLLEFFGTKLYCVLLLFPMLGRMAIVTGCWLFSYARSEGIGKVFIDKNNSKEFMISFIITLIASVFLIGIRGIVILGCIILLVTLFGRYFSNRFGGITGDNLGFMNELGELVALVGVIVVI